MIPEEDRSASWLGDYGGIEADIQKMREFADRLQAEVERNYSPHLRYIADDMTAAIPSPCNAFIELVHFLRAHWENQQATSDMVHALGQATGRLATAAGAIAERYEHSDAFSAARVGDVTHALARPSSVSAPPLTVLTDPTASKIGPVVQP